MISKNVTLFERITKKDFYSSIERKYEKEILEAFIENFFGKFFSTKVRNI